MNRDTLIRFHQQGYRLSVVDGALQVQVENLNPEIEIWLRKNKAELVREIAQATKKPILEYLHYSTGRYGKGPKKFDGATLYFNHVDTGESLYATLNVGLDRQRPSKLHDAGTPLPDKQFHFGKRSFFHKFLIRCRFKIPVRLSTFWQHMGQLKTIFYTATWRDDGKIVNSSLSPCNVTHEEICKALNLPQIPNQFTNKLLTKLRQKSNKTPTRNIDKDSSRGPITRSLHEIPTTCLSNRVKSKQVDKKISNKQVNSQTSTATEEAYTAEEDSNSPSLDTWLPCPKCAGEGCRYCSESHNHVPQPKRGDRDAAWEAIYRGSENRNH